MKKAETARCTRWKNRGAGRGKMKRDRSERRSVGSALFAALAAVILAVGVVVVSPGCTLMARAEGRPVSIDSCTISGGDVVCQVSKIGRAHV